MTTPNPNPKQFPVTFCTCSLSHLLEPCKNSKQGIAKILDKPVKKEKKLNA